MAALLGFSASGTCKSGWWHCTVCLQNSCLDHPAGLKMPRAKFGPDMHRQLCSNCACSICMATGCGHAYGTEKQTGVVAILHVRFTHFSLRPVDDCWLHLETAVMEVRRMKERQKLARQQERYHRQMQLRMERELRNRQITEVTLVE